MTCPTCNDTRRVKRYIGHPGRVAIFVCFDCETPASAEEKRRQAQADTEKKKHGPTHPAGLPHD